MQSEKAEDRDTGLQAAADEKYAAALVKLGELREAIRAAMPRNRNAECRMAGAELAETHQMLADLDQQIRRARAFTWHGGSVAADPVRRLIAI